MAYPGIQGDWLPGKGCRSGYAVHGMKLRLLHTMGTVIDSQDELGVTGAEFFCSPLGNTGPFSYTHKKLKFVDQNVDDDSTWSEMLTCPMNEFPWGIGLAYEAGITSQPENPVRDRIGLLFPKLLCPLGEVAPVYQYQYGIDSYTSNDMDCKERGGIRGVTIRLHEKRQGFLWNRDGISINSFAILCGEDDEEYHKNLALNFLPLTPDESWVILVPPENSFFPKSWQDSQACPEGEAVYAVQARIRNQNMGIANIGGITGLRFYCSDTKTSSHQASPRVFEFPGMLGDWGAIFACSDGHWAKGINVERRNPAGLTQISLSCANENGGLSDQGTITDPYSMQSQGLVPTQGHLKAGSPSHSGHQGEPCQTPFFIGGVAVKEHYYSPSRTLSSGSNFQGLIDLAYICNVYGKMFEINLD